MSPKSGPSTRSCRTSRTGALTSNEAVCTTFRSPPLPGHFRVALPDAALADRACLALGQHAIPAGASEAVDQAKQPTDGLAFAARVREAARAFGIGSPLGAPDDEKRGARAELAIVAWGEGAEWAQAADARAGVKAAGACTAASLEGVAPMLVALRAGEVPPSIAVSVSADDKPDDDEFDVFGSGGGDESMPPGDDDDEDEDPSSSDEDEDPSSSSSEEEEE